MKERQKPTASHLIVVSIWKISPIYKLIKGIKWNCAGWCIYWPRMMAVLDFDVFKELGRRGEMSLHDVLIMN